MRARRHRDGFQELLAGERVVTICITPALRTDFDATITQE